MPLETGFVLNNRYRIVSLLGQGGFGAVYRAWDTSLNRPCAIKENLETSPEAQRQFNREAVILANLSHPNLPRVTDYFSLPDQGQYLVMDFVEGQDLESLVQRQGPVSPDQAMLWIAQVADALDYLHKQDPPVLHRDIKPANVRITPQGKAMLVDFGLVKIYDPALRTTLGARALTPGFAPPEQYGTGNTDPRSDIYALGATLYALLTGKTPIESVQRMAGVELIPLQSANPQVAPSVGQAIDHAMALTPSKRYDTAGEFIQALRQPQPEQKSAVVMPLAASSAAASQAIATPVVKKEDSHPAKGSSSKMWLLIIAGVAACLCLSFVAGGLGLRGMLAKNAQSTSTAKVEQTWTSATDVSISTAIANASAATATSRIAATMNVRSSATAAVKNTQIALTPLPSKTVSAVYTTIPSRTASQGVLYGPQSGSLSHNPGNGLIEEVWSSLNVSDFIVQARFYNPYSRDVGTWDAGFIFRAQNSGKNYRLYVRSSRKWELDYDPGQGDVQTVREGLAANLNVDTNGWNDLKLVCTGDAGEFYINGQLVATIDLSKLTLAGDVAIGTGFLSSHEVSGYSTKYEDFTIWPPK